MDVWIALKKASDTVWGFPAYLQATCHIIGSFQLFESSILISVKRQCYTTIGQMDRDYKLPADHLLRSFSRENPEITGHDPPPHISCI